MNHFDWPSNLDHICFIKKRKCT